METTPARSTDADSPVIAYLLAFVLVGLALSCLGPALSHLRDRVHTDDGGIAGVLAAQAIGYITGSFLGGRLLDRGLGHVAWPVAMGIAVVGTGVGSVMPSLATMMVAFGVVGICCGFGDVCGNTLVVWSRPDGSGSLLNGLHLCFAIGALASPLFVNRSLRWFDSLWGVTVPMAVLAVVASVMMLRRRPPVRTRLATVARSEGTGARNMHVAVVCVFFFSYVALEAGFAGWIHTYAEKIHFGGSATATGLITVFWVGFTLGRMASIWAARRASPGWLLGASVSVCVVATAAFVAFRGAGAMLFVVTFLFAVSIAPQFASMMGFAESHLALSGKNTSAFVAASGVGGLAIPWLLGQLFDNVGAKALPFTMMTMAVVTAVVAGIAGRLLASAHRPPATSTNAPVV